MKYRHLSCKNHQVTPLHYRRIWNLREVLYYEVPFTNKIKIILRHLSIYRAIYFTLSCIITIALLNETGDKNCSIKYWWWHLCYTLRNLGQIQFLADQLQYVCNQATYICDYCRSQWRKLVYCISSVDTGFLSIIFTKIYLLCQMGLIRWLSN